MLGVTAHAATTSAHKLPWLQILFLMSIVLAALDQLFAAADSEQDVQFDHAGFPGYRYVTLNELGFPCAN